jgi:hypothetical protein
MKRFAIFIFDIQTLFRDIIGQLSAELLPLARRRQTGASGFRHIFAMPLIFIDSFAAFRLRMPMAMTRYAVDMPPALPPIDIFIDTISRLSMIAPLPTPLSADYFRDAERHASCCRQLATPPLFRYRQLSFHYARLIFRFQRRAPLPLRCRCAFCQRLCCRAELPRLCRFFTMFSPPFHDAADSHFFDFLPSPTL